MYKMVEKHYSRSHELVEILVLVLVFLPSQFIFHLPYQHPYILPLRYNHIHIFFLFVISSSPSYQLLSIFIQGPKLHGVLLEVATTRLTLLILLVNNAIFLLLREKVEFFFGTIWLFCVSIWSYFHLYCIFYNNVYRLPKSFKYVI